MLVVRPWSQYLSSFLPAFLVVYIDQPEKGQGRGSSKTREPIQRVLRFLPPLLLSAIGLDPTTHDRCRLLRQS